MLMLAALVGGCAETGPKEGVGAVLGAAGGGLLGAQFGSGSGQLAATALGVLAGALIGSNVGRGLDDVDRMMQAEAAQSAFESAPSGATSTWDNPDSGNYGSITPTRTYQAASGEYCREFTQTVTVGGEEQQAFGTACRQPDGTWKIMG
jgi:surface antigen